MSLKERFPAQVPVETARFVEPLLSEGSIYRFIGQEIDQVFSDDDFAAMYADEGRPGVNPVILALVTRFQFVEKLPDRAAAQMAVMRLDWKYALRQSLDWTGFHYSDLCNFRKRLLEHERERGVFERVVTYLREKGYVQAGGKQRTDSTHILGAVRDLSTVELVRETLHITVCALISADAPWTVRYLPASLVETYAAYQRLNWASKIEMTEHLQRMATDGEWLWRQLQQFGTPALQTLLEVRTLRRVLNEQFRPSRETVSYTATGHYRGNYIATPYDTDARRSTQRTTQWVGYKLHVTETISAPQQPRFISPSDLTRSSLKKGAIISLYQTPPVNTHVLCLDELGPFSMKTYLTSRWSPHGYHPHVVPDYGRRGKLWTFGAFEPASGDVLTTTALARRTDDFRLFLDQVAAHWPEGDLIFILDNLSIHRAFDVKFWALAHPRVRFLFQPTYAPWLNLIEPWWKTLRSLALKGRRFETVDQMVRAICDATLYWLDHRHPFRWRKAA